MEQKKYHKVITIGKRGTAEVLKQGDYIVVQEKIDCSNASFTLDDGKVRVFSRNVELSEENNLNGFYQWVMENINPDDLIPEFIYFGEWIGTPHKIKYEKYTKQFFLFDVYDKVDQEYVPNITVEAMLLGVNLVPYLYVGHYQGFEHLQSLCGQTMLEGRLGNLQTGEGIVIKNYDYKDDQGKQVFLKMVTDAFKESKNQLNKAKDPAKIDAESKVTVQFVTEARVSKMLYKLMDDGVLSNQLNMTDMGNVIKAVVPALVEDILTEEADAYFDGYDPKLVTKAVGKYAPKYIRKFIESEA